MSRSVLAVLGLVLVVAAALGVTPRLAVAAQATPVAKDTAQVNEEIVRRFYDAVNAHDFAAYDQFVAEDFVDHDALPGMPPGRQGLKQADDLLLQSFPDASYTIEDVVAAGDRVAVRWFLEGTHKGTFAGVPPTGQPIKAEGISIYRIEGGLIVEAWSVFDALGLYQQLTGS